MKKDNLKKIVGGLIAGGVIAGGSITISDKLNCEVEVNYQGQNICFSQEEVEALQNNLNTPTWDTTQTWDKL